MLSRFREVLSPLSLWVGKALGRLGVSPDLLTALGLAAALATIPSGAFRLYWLIPTLMVVSAVLDWMDGAVARATSKASALGAFMDSFCDRVSDASYLIAFNFLGINTYLILAAIPTSFLVSYIRCRAESLGVRLEGIGLFERGERVLMTVLIGLVTLTVGVLVGECLLAVMVMLNTLTIIQRLVHVIKVLGIGQR
ncbi:MAG: CDP-alcohol phosphatidyltransferase family protein [Sulfolobales archaeon]|nr:CDP-alcohol phosphatidyltransferase family protein [Sulfolobales archaeon]